MSIIQSQHKQISMRQKVNYDSWPIDWLASYVEKLQRKNITEKATDILQNIKRARYNCAGKNNYFLELETHFTASLDRLYIHMKKEEQHLFPFVREMVQAKELNRCINRAALDQIEWLIETLNDEHAAERRHLKWIVEFRDNYITVLNLNKPLNTLLTRLNEFEQGCELHINLQYKFLFPKIVTAKYAVA